MRIIDKLSYSQNWNVGFCKQSPENFLHTKSINRIKWMKHPYRDRWFADPFILNVTDEEIVIFVEECKIDHPKGILCELVVERKTKRLKKRYVLLELETHLSYPAIIRKNGKVYVYPENGASRKLTIYEYDEINHKLINPMCLLDMALADSTILESQDHYHLIATCFPDTQENAFSFSSNSLFGPYVLDSINPFQKSREFSRPAGNWIVLGDQLFRPAQDCIKRYGSSISIMNVSILNGVIRENCVFKVLPQSPRYSRGIHTINFKDDICVVDSYGYLHPFWGSLISFLRRIKHHFNL